ncbi:MAG: hypothetical protein NPIRA03_19670 [Nitrospirales bacterium]|nr:MAG: hypothetical protein NPIRA03_19670 [Nitrospirales bacterium]
MGDPLLLSNERLLRTDMVPGGMVPDDRDDDSGFLESEFCDGGNRGREFKESDLHGAASEFG